MSELMFTRPQEGGEGGDNGACPSDLEILKNVHAALSIVLRNVAAASIYNQPAVEHGVDFYHEVRRFEMNLILLALREARGRQKHAATLLGLKPTTLNSKIKAYGIDWRL